ncbi:hypothetical protein [Streptomyces sp. NPDC059402]|uniref:hypothetical protein n=1 Tax=Streptomyces sp. NPDC059402 TaxID=3346822 RepID=UPI0036B51141
MRLRTSHGPFSEAVDRWFDVLINFCLWARLTALAPPRDLSVTRQTALLDALRAAAESVAASRRRGPQAAVHGPEVSR